MTGISRMLDFLTALKVNNDRQWFGVHKEEYNDIRRQCLEEVGVLIAEIERYKAHSRSRGLKMLPLCHSFPFPV